MADFAALNPDLRNNFANMYGSNVYTLAQQKGSVLRSCVVNETLVGEKKFFEIIGKAKATKITSRFTKTDDVAQQTDLYRRMLMGDVWAWTQMLDFTDGYNVLIDPTSNLTRVAGYAMGRVIDQIIIAGITGNAYEGKNGETVVAYPSANKVPITFGGSENTGLTIEKLMRARSIIGNADVDLDAPENELFIAVTQKQLDDLAAEVDIANSNYLALRDLYTGKTKQFLGFTFVRCGLTDTTTVGSGKSRCLPVWCKSGVVLATAKEMSMEINQRPDVMNNWQAIAKIKGGATRFEDAKTAQIFAYEE